MKAYLNLGFAILIIAAFIFSISGKEKIISDGKTIYLALAPVDPRSIMQGDYMRLRYEIETEKTKNKTGYLILELDDKNIASFVKFDDGTIITLKQIMFKYIAKGSRVNIAPSSFLFQQGLREIYQTAEYGIFKITGKQHLLVGLADGDLKEIKPLAPENSD
ncbi:MAG: GDYXXLXY domain-containing protein [Devosiaceae bacterium]|nr:GDYXXLXY domain-containing protein [Devosiaceae bacterium]